MKKNVFGFAIAICTLIFGAFVTYYLQHKSRRFAVSSAVQIKHDFSPPDFSEVSFDDINRLEYGKKIRVRVRMNKGDCISPLQSDYTPERRAQCLREDQSRLCVPMMEPNYPSDYDVKNGGFDSKSAVRSRFVGDSKSYLNLHPNWFDGSTEVVVTGQKIRIRNSENVLDTCYNESGGDLFEIYNVEVKPEAK